MDDSTRFCSNSILDQNCGNYSTKSHDEILLKLDTRRKFIITRRLDEMTRRDFAETRYSTKIVEITRRLDEMTRRDFAETRYSTKIAEITRRILFSRRVTETGGEIGLIKWSHFTDGPLVYPCTV